MDALDFINVIMPFHDRSSCSDESIDNGFYTRNGGDDWHGRCTRCMYLEIIAGNAPELKDDELHELCG